MSDSAGAVVTYAVAAGGSDIAARARDICIEQTAEVSEPLCRDPAIADRILGRIESIDEERPGRYRVRIRYSGDVLTDELPQILSVIFGNVSLKRGVRVEALDLDAAFARRLTGPRFGIQGLRDRLDARSRPLVASALKPLGRTTDELARYAYDLALGGIDLIKDDHGVANQRFSPFSERVPACADAVARANAVTGGRSLYFPTVTGPVDRILERADLAARSGAGGLLVSPLVTGPDFLRVLSAKTGLPVMAHPALAGAFDATPEHGIATDVLLGTLMRVAGADLVIFPSWGGRFPVARECCRRLDDALKRDMAGLNPAFPVPAGGLPIDRVSELADVYGSDVVFLVGSALFERSTDLAANARYFRSRVDPAYST
jgi:ribulose-bisphosphate carboxylase large chain